MAANVEAVALVVHGARNAADIDGVALDDGDAAAGLGELVGGRQARGACTDDESFDMHQGTTVLRLESRERKPPANDTCLWARNE
ncbi:hypothetical protein D3C72_1769120 [compost metagenome]